MATYVITGGCGYLSVNLANNLVNSGHQVKVIENQISDYATKLKPDVDYVLGDIHCENFMLEQISNCAGCFHITAKINSHQQENFSADDYLNLLKTSCLLFETAAQLNIPVVYSSSSSVYGNNIDYPLTEQSITQPTNLFGASMIALEQYARVTALKHQLPITGLRLFEVYGGSTNNHHITSKIAQQLKQSTQQQDKIVIKETLHSIYDFIHIDDVVRGFICAMESVTTPAQLINLCSGQSITANHFISSILNIMSLANKTKLLNEDKGKAYLTVGDNKLSKQILKFEPQINLLDGLSYTFKPLVEKYQTIVY